VIVRATAGAASLDPTFRGDAPWPTELKRALIERGYALTDQALEQSGGLEQLDPVGLRSRAGSRSERL